MIVHLRRWTWKVFCGRAVDAVQNLQLLQFGSVIVVVLLGRMRVAFFVGEGLGLEVVHVEHLRMPGL